MFHASTTIWHSHTNTDPLSVKNGRFVFRVMDRLTNAWGTVGNVTRPFRGAFNLLMAPITYPTKAMLYGIRSAYRGIIKPITKATLIISGTAYEAGAGLKDTIVNPTRTMVKASLTDIKANIWDLPMHILKKGFRFPFDVVKAPGRFLGGAWEMLKDIPKNIGNLINNTRQNLDSVLNNLVSLNPKETVKSTVKMARDAVKDIFVNPVKSAIKPISKPVVPLTELPVGSAKIFAYSKYQYAPSLVKSFREFINGLIRIKNAPGTELPADKLQALRQIHGESKPKLSYANEAETAASTSPRRGGGRQRTAAAAA